ncbi:MAG: pantoate--beta-alanine ligase, partial [Limnohabitans sp.]
MIIVRTPQALREALSSSVCPAFVPTMGNLHEGHMKLVRVAREQGDRSVASYDPDTGKQHWYFKGPTEQYVASLVYNEKADLLFMTAGFPQHHLLGLRHTGSGHLGDIYHLPEITHPQVAWHHTKASMVSYVPSPISEGDYFLVVGDQGHANCLLAKTGEPLWSEKIGRSHASLVSANGLVYFLNDDGVAYVVKPGRTFELVAKNELGEP